MKKQSAGQVSSHVHGQYLCTACGAKFAYIEGELACPECKAGANETLVPIYVEEREGREELIADSDLSAGD